MKKIAVLVLAFWQLTALAGDKLSLEDCRQMAINNNKDLDSREQNSKWPDMTARLRGPIISRRFQRLPPTSIPEADFP